MRLKRVINVFLFVMIFSLNLISSDYKNVELLKEHKLLKRTPVVLKWIGNNKVLIKDNGKLFVLSVKKLKKRSFFVDKEIKLFNRYNINAYKFVAQKNYRFFLYKTEKDYFYYDKYKRFLVKLIDFPEEGENHTFSPDGKKIAFTVSNNLYYYDVSKKKLFSITSEKDKQILNGYASWVYYEEILGRASRYKAFYWSPDSKKIVFLRFDERKVKKFPIFIPDSLYGKIEWQAYPKAGEKNPTAELILYFLERKKTVKINYPQMDSYHYVAFPFWGMDSKELYFQVIPRVQKKLYIYSYSLLKNSTKLLYEEAQNSWVEFFEKKDFKILENGDFVFISSKDGWRNIYYFNRESLKDKKLTKGLWLVNEILGVKNGKIYFLSRNPLSTDLNLFVLNTKDLKVKRITKSSGYHTVLLSNDFKTFIDSYSTVNNPKKVFVVFKNGKRKLLWDSFSKKSLEYKVSKVELKWIDIRDGVRLPAIFFYPYNFSKTKKYPVLLYVYGGPGVSIVRNMFYRYRWSYLTQKGIVVVMVDHRGSGHFGKKKEALMYGKLGKIELEDYIDFKKALGKLGYLDTKKLCIMGGSYGGYITLYALTKGADYFKCGVSNFPVTDWRLYDSVYTERYMGLPEDNREGYKEASVLSYIKNFNGKLLLTHGSSDDNVHFQNSMRFIDLMENEGKIFEFMLYIKERHGVRGKKYKHYLMTIYNFIEKNLLK